MNSKRQLACWGLQQPTKYAVLQWRVWCNAGSLLGNSKRGQDKGGQRWESHLGLAGGERKVFVVSMATHYPEEMSRCSYTPVRACHALIQGSDLENDLGAPKCMHVCTSTQVCLCTCTHTLTHKCSLHITLHSSANSNQAEGQAEDCLAQQQ